LNGYIYANSPPFEMCQNENTIWYIWDMGFDTHVMHWHGNNVWENDQNVGTVTINPGQATTVTMQPASYGFWHFLCHFNTHMRKGMEAIYIVYPEGECPLPALSTFDPSTVTYNPTGEYPGYPDGPTTTTTAKTTTSTANTGVGDSGIGDTGNYDSGNYDSGNYDSGNYDSGNYESGNNEN
jgi:hypothetical protein